MFIKTQHILDWNNCRGLILSHFLWPLAGIDFGLFEKHTNSEKIFFMVLTFTFFKFWVLLRKSKLYRNVPFPSENSLVNSLRSLWEWKPFHSFSRKSLFWDNLLCWPANDKNSIFCRAKYIAWHYMTRTSNEKAIDFQARTKKQKRGLLSSPE